MKLTSLYDALAANLTASYIEINPTDERRALSDVISNQLRRFTEPFDCFFFDLSEGLQKISLDDENNITFTKDGIKGWDPNIPEPHVSVLKFIEEYKNTAFFFLVDYHPLLPGGDNEKLVVCRAFKNMLFNLKTMRKRVILIGSSFNFSPNFSSLLYRFEIPLPNPEEIREEINLRLNELSERFSIENRPLDISEMTEPGIRDRMTQAAQGLSFSAINDAIRFAVRRDLKMGSNIVETLYQFKLEELFKHNIEFAPPPDVEVGGFTNLKNWLKTRTILFSVDAQSHSVPLPQPRGILLVGTPGSGKSLIAKAVGFKWSMPTLKLNTSSVLGSLVGQSEGNLSMALKLAEAISPCVLMLDEVDKMFSNVMGSSGDSGVNQRLFGMFLSWMQEKTKPVFVIATANSIENIPPEFSRKGRFDAIFYVGLPSIEEREEIVRAHLAKNGVLIDHELGSITSSEIKEVAILTDGFSGAEIASVISECAIIAVCNQRAQKITYEDLKAEILATKPQSVANPKMLDDLEAWAKEHARNASIEESIDESQASISGMM